jgi:peptidoglycan/xylan/chitin deacetylase (PgdA/CDA1 family)
MSEGPSPVSRRSALRWAGGAAVLAAIATQLPDPGLSPPITRLADVLPATPPRRPVRTVADLRPGAPRNAIALTIDDGPDPRYTPQILDLLRRNKVQATFSLIGEHVHTYPDLVRQIAGEGHSVCNHTMTHPQPFSHRPPEVILRQITDAQSVIVEAGVKAPTLFRSPGGDWSAGVLATAAKLAMIPLDWDIDPRDWSRPGTAAVTARLLAARPGDILLCHDGGGNRAATVASLRVVLPTLRSRGLDFVAL